MPPGFSHKPQGFYFVLQGKYKKPQGFYEIGEGFYFIAQGKYKKPQGFYKTRKGFYFMAQGRYKKTQGFNQKAQGIINQSKRINKQKQIKYPIAPTQGQAHLRFAPGPPATQKPQKSLPLSRPTYKQKLYTTRKESPRTKIKPQETYSQPE